MLLFALLVSYPSIDSYDGYDTSVLGVFTTRDLADAAMNTCIDEGGYNADRLSIVSMHADRLYTIGHLSPGF